MATNKIEKIIALDWYDGACLGLLKGNFLKEWQHFKLIDWDNEQTIRIFALEPVNHNVADELISYLKNKKLKPRWPVWVILLNNIEAALQDEIKKSTDRIMKITKKDCYLLVVDNTDDSIIKIADIPNDEEKYIPYWFEHEGHGLTRDWFEYLNIKR